MKKLFKIIVAAGAVIGGAAGALYLIEKKREADLDDVFDDDLDDIFDDDEDADRDYVTLDFDAEGKEPDTE